MSKKTQALSQKTKNEIAQLSADQIASLKKVEHVGTAMMQTAQEFTLMIHHVLMKDFGFKEKDLQQLDKEVSLMLETAGPLESVGLSFMTYDSMKILGSMAESRRKRIAAKDSGILLPDSQMQKGVLDIANAARLNKKK